ncbi:hypothetical protein N665_0094s0064 [Sinapis alba]|nr:hypothetical protein N665_0094s0064 [Sinapis alba]
MSELDHVLSMCPELKRALIGPKSHIITNYHSVQSQQVITLIRRFDRVRIKEAFAEIGKAAPEPSWIIDSLGLLSDKFGKRAGNMKMASLAAYFGLGVQKHRSLDDVRMNLEVLTNCATVLFLESTLPNQLEGKWQSSSKIMTRSRSSYQTAQRAMPYSKGSLGKIIVFLHLQTKLS